MDSLSYNLGVLLAQNLKQQGFDTLNPQELATGIEDMMAGAPKVDLQQANAIVQQFIQAKQATMHGDNKEAGEQFLVENAKREQVKVTESGLQYEVLQEGNGSSPKPTDQVTVHYHGTLIDGTVFDSSVRRGQPATFGLNQVISGWTEGLQLMKEGAKYRFFVPYNLAYGSREAGDTIKPFSTLIFDVDLLKVQ